MPDVKTRADSLYEYLTGAASDGGAQIDPALSLGNYRSSTEAVSFGINLTNAITNLTVDFASGGNAEGDGTLTLIDADHVAWQDSAGVQGTPILLAGNGDSAIVEDGTNPSAYLRVTRTSDDDMAGGPCTVTLTVLYNNQFGMENVPAANATAGENIYHASIVRNEASGAVTGFKRWIGTLGTQQVSDGGQLGVSGSGTITTTGDFDDWPDSGFCHIRDSGGTTTEIVYYHSRTATVLTVPSSGRGLLGTSAAAGASNDTLDAVPGVAIAKDPDGIEAFGENIQTIADANTEPVGVTWNVGITESTGLNIGTLEPDQQIGIWVWRHTPAGANASPDMPVRYIDRFDAS